RRRSGLWVVRQYAARLPMRSGDSRTMYHQYYRLTGRPFERAPDPRYYFASSVHRKAMAYLGYGLAQGEGFIIVTGEAGTGKTMLVDQLMATIDPRRLMAVKLAAAPGEGDDILN